VTHQLDPSSCGVHSIANAIVLCNNGLPEWHYYIRNEMREHLVSIINNGDHVEEFPKILIPCNIHEPSIKFKPVFCYCRQENDKTEMVQCYRHVFIRIHFLLYNTLILIYISQYNRMIHFISFKNYFIIFE
jgi:hypothetical protein